jgi:hypothetical protein
MSRVLRSGDCGLVDENATANSVEAIMLLARRYLSLDSASAEVVEDAGTGLMLWYWGAMLLCSGLIA